jgi:hypothetical protein
MLLAALFAMLLAIPMAADAHTKRSQSAKVEFKLSHPCPATGARRGPCHGYVIDHVKPLCAGGADRPENMAWQEYKESLKKDAQERRECRALKRLSDTPARER